ncbi:MAG: hypothetical protein ACKPKO_54445, partial [Candidatus Fonsibacter sp.]
IKPLIIMFKLKQTLIISCMYYALFFLSDLHAQEIQCQVNVDLNNIPFDNRFTALDYTLDSMSSRTTFSLNTCLTKN